MTISRLGRASSDLIKAWKSANAACAQVSSRTSACGDGQTSDKNPHIKPTADLEVLFQRKDHANRCPEEIVVTTTLALRALEVIFADAKHAVKIPADLATATMKGFAPVERVIAPLALVLFAGNSGVTITQAKPSMFGQIRDAFDSPRSVSSNTSSRTVGSLSCGLI